MMQRDSFLQWKDALESPLLKFSSDKSFEEVKTVAKRRKNVVKTCSELLFKLMLQNATDHNI